MKIKNKLLAYTNEIKANAKSLYFGYRHCHKTINIVLFCTLLSLLIPYYITNSTNIAFEKIINQINSNLELYKKYSELLKNAFHLFAIIIAAIWT